MKTTQEKKRRSFQPDVHHVALFLSFFAPFTIMLAIFIGNSIYPFGGRSFLFSDMYHQYMPFFQEFLTRIKAGDGINYTWNVGMGSNYLALYVYYTASPLHWLAFLVPERFLMEFMSYLVVVKLGLMGLTSYLYLRSRGEGSPSLQRCIPAVLISVFYAMSGFLAAYNWNIMWLDPVILLPLILMGLEKLVKQGKMGLYCATLGLCIFSNFYISIMICIFLVLYFFVLFFTEKPGLKGMIRFGAASLLAGGLAAIFLVPAVCALLATDFGDMDFPKKWQSYFSILDVLARHCMGISTERGLDHWPNIYCGSMVFFLVPLYALNEGIPAKRRFGSLALAGIFLISFATNGLDFIWHGLNYPDSLPGRQSFIYILLLLVMCYECVIKIDRVQPSAIVKSVLGATFALLLVEKFVESDDFQTWTWLMNLFFVVLYAAVLYVYRTKSGWKVFTVVGVLAFIAVLAETAVNMSLTSVGTTSRTEYLADLGDYEALYQRNVQRTEGFTRFEKFTRKTKNDSTLVGFPSASVFSSTMNSIVMDFYKMLGMRNSKVYYGYDGATAFSSALLNVGYLFGESDEYENELFQLIDRQGKISLYEAVYSLPFGYVAPTGYDLPAKMEDKTVRIQNKLVQQLGVEGTLLEEQVQGSGKDVLFTPKEGGIYYGCVMNSGTKKVDVVGGTPGEQNFKDLKKGCILYLGYLEKDQTVTLTNGDSEDETPNIVVYIYKLNTKVLGEALEILGRRHMTEVRVENTHISGKLSLEEAGRLILSVPYEKGWSVYVNGEETEPQTFGGAFLALDLEPGEYDIELQYVPQGKYAGIAITLVSLLIFAAAALYQRRKKIKLEREMQGSTAQESTM